MVSIEKTEKIIATTLQKSWFSELEPNFQFTPPDRGKTKHKYKISNDFRVAKHRKKRVLIPEHCKTSRENDSQEFGTPWNSNMGDMGPEISEQSMDKLSEVFSEICWFSVYFGLRIFFAPHSLWVCYSYIMPFFFQNINVGNHIKVSSFLDLVIPRSSMLWPRRGQKNGP